MQPNAFDDLLRKKPFYKRPMLLLALAVGLVYGGIMAFSFGVQFYAFSHYPRGGTETSYETEYNDCSLYAKLKFSPRSEGRVFQLDLRPPQKQLPNGFERKALGGRILVKDVPNLGKPPKGMGLKGQKTMLARVEEMLARDQIFLGRRWVQIYGKKKKSSGLDALIKRTDPRRKFKRTQSLQVETNVSPLAGVEVELPSPVVDNDVGPWSTEAGDLFDWRPPGRG